MRKPKLNLLLAKEIRRRVADGERQVDLAAEFGVKPPAVNAVVQGRLYPDEPRQPRQPTPARPRQLTPNATRILEVLKGRSSALSPMELVETTGLSRFAVGDALRTLRRAGLIERLGSGHETGYRLTRAPSVRSAPRGDRPRKLGFRTAWLRQHGPQAEMVEEA